MTIRTAMLATSLALAVPAIAQVEPPRSGNEAVAQQGHSAPAPGEIVAAAPAKDWVAIAPADLLVMTLAPDRDGKPRQAIIQLMPPPFSQGWIGNIRKLAAAHWWDGTSVNRVQDNYVVQWGDPEAEDKAKAKALPAGLNVPMEKDYLGPASPVVEAAMREYRRLASAPNTTVAKRHDSYAATTAVWNGWPMASDFRTGGWPVHCYGMVGVGRDMPPDTGSGAELYMVIGHAPRHLDRNIALVGRVIEGIEHLSSLPRGTGALGFYEKPEQRVPIVSIRLASELPAAEQPKFEHLSTESASFHRYADARANRRDPFFIVPAGGADICNVPVPVRRSPPTLARE